jgi:hypothetical protein
MQPTTPGGRFPLLLLWCKGSARRTQSRVYSGFAEPQPSLALYLKYNAKVQKIIETTKLYIKRYK